jgi:8-oxo-dGTP pyrophosphatase MutT (NUDIX family)
MIRSTISSVLAAVTSLEAQTEPDVYEAFLARAQEGAPTRDEDPYTHFCVYFAAYDPRAQKVFIGHHKKSGFWLFNGGHIDQGETVADAVGREIEEEWGIDASYMTIGVPQLLTLTDIDNPLKQTCTRHYDLWHFLPLDHDQIQFEPEKLEKEFHTSGWLTLAEATAHVTDPATLQALSYIENMLV